MSVKLLTEHHLEFLILERDHTGSSESTLVIMSHVTSHVLTSDVNNYDPRENSHSCHILSCLHGHNMGLDLRNLSSGFPIKLDSNQSPKLQRLARMVTFRL